MVFGGSAGFILSVGLGGGLGFSPLLMGLSGGEGTTVAGGAGEILTCLVLGFGVVGGCATGLQEGDSATSGLASRSSVFTCWDCSDESRNERYKVGENVDLCSFFFFLQKKTSPLLSCFAL